MAQEGKHTAHTPGPWSLTKYAYQDWYSVQAFTGMKGLPRETGYSCMAAPAPHGKDNAAEQEANARLIAAAPDLLAALKDCLDRFVEAFPAAAEYEPIKRGFAAIAKAGGRSNA